MYSLPTQIQEVEGWEGITDELYRLFSNLNYSLEKASQGVKRIKGLDRIWVSTLEELFRECEKRDEGNDDIFALHPSSLPYQLDPVIKSLKEKKRGNEYLGWFISNLPTLYDCITCKSNRSILSKAIGTAPITSTLALVQEGLTRDRELMEVSEFCGI